MHPLVHMDVKSTHGKDSISIKRKDLEEVIEQGNEKNKIGCLGFKFFRDNKLYVIISLEEFKKYVDARSGSYSINWDEVG